MRVVPCVVNSSETLYRGGPIWNTDAEAKLLGRQAAATAGERTRHGAGAAAASCPGTRGRPLTSNSRVARKLSPDEQRHAVGQADKRHRVQVSALRPGAVRGMRRWRLCLEPQSRSPARALLRLRDAIPSDHTVCSNKKICRRAGLGGDGSGAGRVARPGRRRVRAGGNDVAGQWRSDGNVDERLVDLRARDRELETSITP